MVFQSIKNQFINESINEINKKESLLNKKEFSGQMNLRIPPLLHKDLALLSLYKGDSINIFITSLLEKSVEELKKGKILIAR